MKIVSLNVWHGDLLDGLTQFIEEAQSSTDVFCFQEADSVLRQKIRDLLPGFAEFAHDKRDDASDDPDHAHFEIATYVKNDHLVAHFEVLLDSANDVGGILVTELHTPGGKLAVVNVHGISYRGDSKLDTDGRFKQNGAILAAYQDAMYPVIICGDFNMLPEAQSIQLFAQQGYQDLIASYKIQKTRNHFAWDRYPLSPQYFADFAFTNPYVKMRTFAVPDIEASDHLPLILDAELLVAEQPTKAKLLELDIS